MSHIFKLVSSAATVLVITPLMLAGSANASSAGIITWGYTYNMSSFAKSDRCINAPNSTPGALLDQEPCFDSYTGEEWTLYEISPPGIYGGQTIFLMYNYHTGLCASIYHNTNSPGSAVDQANCNWSGSNYYEDWFHEAIYGNIPGCAYQYSITWCQYTNVGIWNATGNSYSIHPSANSTTAGAGIFVNDGSCLCQDAYYYYYPPMVTGLSREGKFANSPGLPRG